VKAFSRIYNRKFLSVVVTMERNGQHLLSKGFQVPYMELCIAQMDTWS